MILAIAMPLVVGAGGLAVETSFDYISQSQLQSAADAAAYAAGLEKTASSPPDVVLAAARQQANANGWTANNGTLTLNTPPATGPNAGAANATEILLTQQAPRFFTAYFSSQPVNLRARAVATSITAANACILALNGTAQKAIQVQGNSTLTLNGCDVMSDSVAANAVNVWGSANMTADCAVSVGGVANNGGMTLTGCPSAITQAPRVGDPFAGLPTPLPGTTRNIPNGNNPHGLSLSPGSYSGGMDLSGTVTLSPGTYYVSGGDFNVNANASVSGSGVTIYMAAGSHVSINGNADVNLSAPTSGTYSGILFFGDRNDTSGVSNTFNGDASSSLTGDIYFPSQQVSYLGNFSGINGCTQIIADTVQWSGNATVGVNCAAQGMQNIPARQAVKLVE
jgi:hypothetical protein